MNNDMYNKNLEKLKKNIAIYNFKEELINKRKNHNITRKIIATACASLVLVSGIVLAANIENIKTHFRGLGKGVDTAVENGYIANPNAEKTDSNTIAINKEIKVDNISAKINIENFLMDDVNLSTQILFNFDNKIKEVVDLEKVTSIELTDLIVRDEENRIIYGGNNEERFKKYCEENSLDYTFDEFNDNYMNCGVNCFSVMRDKESNSIKIMYNMYTDKFPKSKKLYFSFKTIQMLEISSEEAMQNKIIVNGNWDISVDVPKEMYTRIDEYYKVVSCDNPNFNVYTAKATNTGFEIGIIISNIKKPEIDYKLMKEYANSKDDYNTGKISKERYEYLMNWYNNLKYLMSPMDSQNTDGTKKESYLENEYGEKFESNFSPSRKVERKFLLEDKYNFYETYTLSKYTSTNKITLVLYYYGEPVTIKLIKI